MRGERQMNKNSQRLEDGASGSPYVNRYGEYAINSIWSIVGYTVLLCLTLFKTGSVARSILGAH